jgi:hypothetical protein
MLPILKDRDRRISRLALGGVPIGFVLIVVGLAIEDPDSSRLMPGGVSLVIASMAAAGAIVQIGSGFTCIPDVANRGRMRWVQKSDFPIPYWSTTLMLLTCALSGLTFTTAVFAWSIRILE